MTTTVASNVDIAVRTQAEYFGAAGTTWPGR